jgi:hypothetical protein
MLCAIIFSLSLSCAAWCGEADVERVTVTPVGERTFRFDVTVRHDDTGWDHYADKWEVLAPHGETLGTRTLLHPHVNEQPFTRSLTGVAIPQHVSEVTVRAHDSVHEYGGKTVTVNVPQ